jgi:hypothetical protein
MRGLSLSLLAVATILAISGAGGGEPATDPYLHDPTLDLNQFEFHAGAGYWGTQNTVKEVASPAGSLTAVNVGSQAAMEAAYLSGRHISLTADIDFGGGQLEGSIADLRISLNGFKLSNVRFGTILGSDQGDRIEIEGPGQLHSADFCNVNDLHIRDCEVSGPGGNAYAIIVREFGGGTSRRFAATNIVANCGGYFYIGDAWDTFFRNVSVRTGSELVSPAPAEAWGIRIAHVAGGNHILSNVDLRIDPGRSDPNAHHNFRLHPSADVRYVALHDCTMVHFPSSQAMWINANVGGATMGANVDWLFVKRTRFYHQAGWPNMGIGDTVGATFEDIEVHSDQWDADSYINFDPDPGQVYAVPVENRYLSGSTYGPATAEPAWTGAGNADAVAYE